MSRKYRWTELLDKYHKPCLVCILNPWEVLHDFKICEECLDKFMTKYKHLHKPMSGR